MEKNEQPGSKRGRPARRAGSARPTYAAWMPVLHIEDDENDRELLHTAVLEAGVPFQVHSVSDAAQAVSYLSGTNEYADRRRFPLPSLILLDLKMPGSSGIDVLAWVRSSPELDRVSVIILSGSESEEDMRHAYASGANAYLVKPLGFNALVEMIKAINVGWFVSVQNSSPRINFHLGKPSSARP
jgi:DNA-binding response OmpR family regulator